METSVWQMFVFQSPPTDGVPKISSALVELLHVITCDCSCQTAAKSNSRMCSSQCMWAHVCTRKWRYVLWASEIWCMYQVHPRRSSMYASATNIEELQLGSITCSYGSSPRTLSGETVLWARNTCLSVPTATATPTATPTTITTITTTTAKQLNNNS